ncbi:hypothetical protein C8J57DRAFT_991959, partial [Mycena rebaudengoi]
PPNIHFSGDIPRLFREWESSTLLMVNGRGISIKHWPLFISVGSKAVTSKMVPGIRFGQWGNRKLCQYIHIWLISYLLYLQFLVEERQRFPSDETFWNKYLAADNSHLRYQQILDALNSKEARELKDKTDADGARKFFGGNLDHLDADEVFTYIKNGKRWIKDKDSTVAEILWELLSSNTDIASRW